MRHLLEIWSIGLVFFIMSIMELESLQSSRQRRFLIFPHTSPTRTQWIVGIGFPLEDLVFEAVTTGYVLKVEYMLPYMAEQLRVRNTTPIAGRRRRDLEYSSKPLFEAHLIEEHELYEPITNDEEKLDELMKSSRNVVSSYRWSVYRGLEGLAERLGLPGRSCVLKSICEAAEIPFHYKNGILGDFLHILLTPSSSADELSEHSDNEYFFAETIGRSGAGCNQVFKECSRSLLDHFSNIHTLSKDLTMLLG